MAEMTPLQKKVLTLIQQMVDDAISVTERHLPGMLVNPASPPPALTIVISNLNQAVRWINALKEED